MSTIYKNFSTGEERIRKIIIKEAKKLGILPCRPTEIEILTTHHNTAPTTSNDEMKFTFSIDIKYDPISDIYTFIHKDYKKEIANMAYLDEEISHFLKRQFI